MDMTLAGAPARKVRRAPRRVAPCEWAPHHRAPAVHLWVARMWAARAGQMTGKVLADTPTDWAPIRAAQVHAGGQLALFLLATNVIGAALVTLILERAVPLWALACWGAVVAAVAVAVTFRRLAAKQRARTAATLTDVRDTVIEGVALAAIS